MSGWVRTHGKPNHLTLLSDICIEQKVHMYRNSSIYLVDDLF